MNLEKEIKNWKGKLRKQAHLEDGFITELEVHLRDAIEEEIARGSSESEAFEKAVRNLGDIAAIDEDEKKVLRREGASKPWMPGLVRNFLKVNLRQLRKNGMPNTINVVGLVTAFTALLFIGLYLNDEFSFERHHPEADKIYRVSYKQIGENGEIEDRAFSSGMWLDAVAEQVPGIEASFRFLQISYGYVEDQANNRSFYEEGIYWSDPNFFDFLGFKLKTGNVEDQLKDPSSLILTESTALKLYGNEDPMGKSLRFVRAGNVVEFIVTGVIFDPPSNSQFQPNYIAPLQSVQTIFGNERMGWVDRNPNPGYVFSYIRLSDKASIPQVEKALTEFWNTAIPERSEFMLPLITKLTDIHFQPPVKWEIDNPISKSYLYGLIVIAAFILLIAITNFINLTTAQSGKRQKEIGLRKVLGSTRQQLRLQFFLESFGLVVGSMFMAMFLTWLLSPAFNQMVDKNIQTIEVLSSPKVYSGILAFTVIIGSIAGFLPALYFTRKLRATFNLNQFFKSERTSSSGRNLLVVIQFTVAITLIISTLTVYNQLNLINNGKLAENREAVIGIRTSRMGTAQQAQSFRNEIAGISNVGASTLGMHLPRQSDFGRINTKYFAPSMGTEAYFWNKFDADGDFLKTFDLELLAGRDFRENIEPNALVVNESVVRALGLSAEEALGLSLKEDSINYVFGASDGIIVGVVKDFAYKSIREEIEPLVICANTLVGGALSVKLLADNKLASIEQMREKWTEIYPGRPFEFWFLDKEFDRLYRQERRLGKLIPLFSGLAVVIALLGLFALTAYISDLRRKEIGIRKVLGCSRGGILRLLGWQYLRTLLLAVLIGVPLAWYGMDVWLENFTYRVEMNAFVIAISVVFTLILSLFTVSFKSLKAASENPVKSLKYE